MGSQAEHGPVAVPDYFFAGAEAARGVLLASGLYNDLDSRGEGD